MSIEKLLRPKYVAVVGASESESMGGFATKYLNGNPELTVHFVNPKRDTIYGKKCYHSLEEVPAPLDMVVIATNKNTVEGLLKTAHEKGAGGAVVYASGFGETGNAEDKEAEKRLVDYCHSVGMSLLGPNCNGYINFLDRVFPHAFYFDTNKAPGHVGVISQSGQICSSLLLSHKTSFSYLLSCGNSKVTPIEDFLDYMVEDEETTVIAGYIEGIADAEKFLAVMKKAVAKGKPMVFIKSGRSAKAAQVAASHTGSMTGSDKNIDAIFRKFGVIRVDDIEELACVTSILERLPRLPEKNAIAVMCGSGGESAISADLCDGYGLNCPEFTDDTVAALKRILPDYATPHNPLDMTASAMVDTASNMYAIGSVAADPQVELTVVGVPLFDRERTDTEIFVTSIENLRKERPETNFIVVPNIEMGRLEVMEKRLAAVNVPVLSPGKYAYDSIRKVIGYCEWRKTQAWRTLDLALPAEDGKPAGRKAFSEHDSKEMLKKFGVPVPMELIATSADEAADFAEKIGYPVVMKIESDEILHKSDAKAVMLNINSKEEVRAKFDEILRNVNDYRPGAQYKGILVQKMLKAGTEIIVGVTVDPKFGPMVLVGLGGIFVELFHDAMLYPAPFGREEAMWMLDSLKSSKLFHGYRGAKPLDVDALADTLVAVSNFACANKDNLLEMDINPLFVYPEGEGVAAADGLVVLKA